MHVLDLAPELTAEEDASALSNYEVIERELAAHDPRLAALPRVLALSKSDLLTPAQVAVAVEEWSARLGPEVPVLTTSSATGAGLEELAAQLLASVPASSVSHGEPAQHPAAAARLAPARTHQEDEESELAEHMVFRPAARTGFSVERLRAGAFAVRGQGVERLLHRFDVENDDAMAYVEGRLRRLGVIQALEAEGFEAGDEIEIAGVVLELDPG